MTKLQSPTMAFIHSPFLAPLVWRPVADVVKGMGQPTQLVDMRGALEAKGDFYRAFGRLAARQLVELSVLVAHSGAGAIVPSILEYVTGRVQAVIFVDALLPHPSRRWMDTAPPALAEHLRPAVRNGRVPPWPSWLSKRALAELVPDEAMRRRFVSGAPAVPLAFLEEPAPRVPRWDDPPGCAYLQLSSNYDAEAAQARAFGWPAHRFDGRHLSIMTEPGAIAEAIINLTTILRMSGAENV